MADVQLDYSPSYGINVSVQPRVNLVRFGDGYIQRGANGINLYPAKWRLVFENVSTATAEAIEEKLKEAAGGTLLWKPAPAEESDPYLKWICLQWERRFIDYDTQTLTCELEQVFE